MFTLAGALALVTSGHFSHGQSVKETGPVELPAVAREEEPAAVEEPGPDMVETDEYRPVSKSKGSGENRQLGSSILVRTEARTFNFSVPAPRGQILDRNGRPLAQSKVGYFAAISFPHLGEVPPQEILVYAGERIIRVNELLGTTFDLDPKTVVEHYNNRRWVPLTFSEVLTAEQVEDVKRLRMPGLILHPFYLRHYPEQRVLSHVIGYVGERPPRKLGPIEPEEPLWREGKGVGGGLEEHFDKMLTGTPGRINVIFEEDGTKVKEETLARPKPGFNVVTTIDLDLQKIVEQQLKEQLKRGAMVMMDVRNGDIVAMASYPQFNPNDFVPTIDTEQYAALTSDPDKPLFPRSFGAKYPPASTFKVPVAMAALENRFVTMRTLYNCPTSWTIGDTVMHNWAKEPEGQMNVVGALMRSCNTWFYQVGINLGADPMSAMAMKLGLGVKTGIPLRGESAGFIPDNRWSYRERGHLLSDGEEANISIGQGRVEASPLQIARMMAAVGNGYEVLKPRLVSQVQDLNNEVVQSFPVQAINSLNFQTDALNVVRMGMKNVVGHWRGTGKKAAHPKVSVAGKTGTGQWLGSGDTKQNLAWFAGFFPADNPVYSFAVVYEGDPGETVGGGSKAAPIVGAVLKDYLTDERIAEIKGLKLDRSDDRFTSNDSSPGPVVAAPIRDTSPVVVQTDRGGIFRGSSNRDRPEPISMGSRQRPSVEFGADGLPIFNEPEEEEEAEEPEATEEKPRRGFGLFRRRNKGN